RRFANRWRRRRACPSERDIPHQMACASLKDEFVLIRLGNRATAPIDRMRSPGGGATPPSLHPGSGYRGAGVGGGGESHPAWTASADIAPKSQAAAGLGIRDRAIERRQL